MASVLYALYLYRWHCCVMRSLILPTPFYQIYSTILLFVPAIPIVLGFPFLFYPHMNMPTTTYLPTTIE